MLRPQMTTLENETVRNNGLEGRMNSEPETRMTQNFQPKETLGFDNNKFEFDEVFKAKEQEIRLKSSIVNR